MTELKSLAMLALKNAFYEDFSALVNAYLKAEKGLDDPTLAMQLSEVANVFSRDCEVEGDNRPNIWTQCSGSSLATCGHETILDALEFDRATEVYLQGRRVFERRDGEWHLIDSTVSDRHKPQRTGDTK